MCKLIGGSKSGNWVEVGLEGEMQERPRLNVTLVVRSRGIIILFKLPNLFTNFN